MNNIKTLFLSFIFMANFCHCLAQCSSDTLIANRLFDNGRTFLNSYKLDSAYIYLDSAATIFRSSCIGTDKEKGFKAKYIQSKLLLCNVFAFAEQYKDAKAIVFSAIDEGKRLIGENSPIVSSGYNSLGNVYNHTNLNDSAIFFLKKSLAIRLEKFGELNKFVADSYHNLGNNYYLLGDQEQAQKYFNKSMTIRAALFGENSVPVSQSLEGLAFVFFEQDDYETAIEYLHKSIAILKPNKDNNLRDWAISCRNLANFYIATGEYSKSIELYNEATTIFEKLFGKNNSTYYETIGNLGALYAMKLEGEKARECYNVNLEGLSKDVSDTCSDAALILDNIGLTYLNEKNVKQAQYYFNRSLKIKKNIFGERHPSIGSLYNSLGNLFLATQQYDSALYYYQKALITGHKTFNDTNILTNAPLKDCLNFQTLIATLNGKGIALYERNEGKDTENAIPPLLLAIDYLDSLRYILKKEESQIRLAEYTYSAYEYGAKAALRLQKPELAFFFAERAKGGALRQMLSESNAVKNAGLPKDLVEKENSIRTNIAFYQKSIFELELLTAENRDSTKLHYFTEALFNANREKELLHTQIVSNYPKYNTLVNDKNVANISEIQAYLAKLPQKTTLVEYFTGDSSLFIFIITDKTFKAFETKINTLSQDIIALRERILNFQTNYNVTKSEFIDLSQKLYQTLISPIENKLRTKQIIIIRDGILDLLPFDVLLKPNKDIMSFSYQSLPYLTKSYGISYALSATILKDSKILPPNNTYDLLAIAPIFGKSIIDQVVSENELVNISIADSTSAKSTVDIADATRAILVNGKEIYLPPLPASEKEVLSISKLFESSKVKILTKKQATETNLKKELSQYNYIHLATHGHVDEKKPALSAIYFADDSSSTNDGIMYNGEVYNLQLNADLVTLSACETALGKIHKGEGLLGITRGLIYSGARNVLATLWSVADQTTANIMIEFYKRMKEHKNKTSALQSAKLTLLNHPTYSAPYYWAPFTLLGNGY